MKRSLLVFIVLICFVWVSCKNNTSSDDSVNPDNVIKKQDIENIVATLSDDSMQGRLGFSEASKRAADYIIGKFEEIGLEPVDNQSTFLHEFSRYRLTPTSSTLELNGETVPSDSFFVQSSHQSINWNDISNFKTIVIGPDDPIGNASTIDEDCIVFVDPSHQEDFESQYSEAYGGIKLTFNPDEGPSKLFILTSSTAANSGSFSYSASIEEEVGQNVVGQIPGTSSDNKKVIFGAHYDHVGFLEPVNGDSIANGADDNASGTAALIQLAKYFKQSDQPKRTLIFAAFGAEEQGLIGSFFYSREVTPSQVAAVINMDMIGKPSKFGPNSAFLTGFEKSDMGDILRTNLKDSKYDIHPDPYPDFQLFYRSDNLYFANLGIPAHTISTVQIDTDQYYHTVDDEINTLDLGNLTNLTRAIAKGAQSIVDGSDTPSRIQTSKLNQQKWKAPLLLKNNLTNPGKY